MKRKLTIISFVITLIFVNCSTYKVANSQRRFLLNDNGKGKYYLIEYIKTERAKHILGEIPTLMIHQVDGQLIVRCDEDYFEKLSLQKKDIKRIEIISLQKAPTLYGSAGKNGVINIYTYAKPSNNKTTANRR